MAGRGPGAASRTIRPRWRWRRPTRTGGRRCRMVLLKGHDERGFVFYTNLDSRKGERARRQPPAPPCSSTGSRFAARSGSKGRSRPVGEAEADAYFATRSRNSQLGAWASDQSRPLEARAVFEARYEEMKRRFEGGDVPRPPRWSGWRVVPERIEFWTSRDHRLHERRLFTPDGRRRVERRPALPVNAAARRAPRPTLR